MSQHMECIAAAIEQRTRELAAPHVTPAPRSPLNIWSVQRTLAAAFKDDPRFRPAKPGGERIISREVDK
jgi:hypothetical protein